MTLDQFFSTHNGKKVDYDQHYGAQCKDLFSYYNRDVALNPAYVPGDAWQLYVNCPAAYYEKVTGPRKGDVAIWQQQFGGYGHVAIVWDGGKFFSQNYPLGAPCSLQTIPTDKILGYLRPTKLPNPMDIKQYNEKIIRQNEQNKPSSGGFALVIREKKFVFPADHGLGTQALLTFMQRNPQSPFKGQIVNVNEATWNAIPNSNGLNF